MELLDEFVQLAPPCHAIDLNKKTVAPGELFLIRGRSSAFCMVDGGRGNVALLSQVAAPAGTRAVELVGVFRANERGTVHLGVQFSADLFCK
jgi:hypothetical protein